ncbi:MAG TPA: helix-turn-helix transcriptional regulator [Acidimicrobiales bacterium]
MRRKPGAVLPLEAAILAAAVELSTAGTVHFHGFLLAKHLRDAEGARLLTAHGTLYKALGRMEKAGWLASDWEDPDVAAEEGRPRRRLYEITAAGRTALAETVRDADGVIGFDPGWNPS